jgi:glutamate dehydrogenase
VVTSVDLRDLKRTTSEELVAQLESVLATIKVRARGEINTSVHPSGEVIVLESCVEDQPFLVSSLRALFAAENIEVVSLINSIIKIRRDAAGTLASIGMGTPESIIRVEVAADSAPADIADRFRQRLRIVQAMVRDFQPMKRRMQDLADDYLRAATAEGGERSLTLRETEGMVRWLCEENYVLLSVEEYDEVGRRLSALGTTSVAGPERDPEKFTQYARDFARTVRYQRSVDESPVHRAGKPGHFIINRVSREGSPPAPA